MIVAIGELLLDFYPDFKCLGGATANFIYHLSKFKQEARLISCIGNDDISQEILSELGKRKINTDYIQVDGSKPTGYVTVRLLDKGQPLFNISADLAFDYIRFTRALKDLLKKDLKLIYTGTISQRNEVSRSTTIEILSNKSKGTAGFIDLNLRQKFYSKEIIENTFKYMNIVKCNTAELAKIKELWKSKFSEVDFCRRLMKDYGIEWFCVTKGEEGSILYSKEGMNEEPIAENINVIDTVGAGDGFCAILALGYLNKWGPALTLKRATLFAGKLCEVSGAIPEDNFYGEFLAWTE